MGPYPITPPARDAPCSRAGSHALPATTPATAPPPPWSHPLGAATGQGAGPSAAPHRNTQGPKASDGHIRSPHPLATPPPPPREATRFPPPRPPPHPQPPWSQPLGAATGQGAGPSAAPHRSTQGARSSHGAISDHPTRSRRPLLPRGKPPTSRRRPPPQHRAIHKSQLPLLPSPGEGGQAAPAIRERLDHHDLRRRDLDNEDAGRKREAILKANRDYAPPPKPPSPSLASLRSMLRY